MIYSAGKQAPCFTSFDRSLAYVELEDRKRGQGYTSVRMETEVRLFDPTKQEQYVWLVYRVLKAIRKYYDERGRVTKEQSDANLKASLALESELDKWNVRTRFYLNQHPKASHGDEKAFAFFEVVEEWRNCWHKYFSYKKLRDKHPVVEREMKKQCFDYEKEIRKYVNLVIGL